MYHFFLPTSSWHGLGAHFHNQILRLGAAVTESQDYCGLSFGVEAWGILQGLEHEQMYWMNVCFLPHKIFKRRTPSYSSHYKKYDSLPRNKHFPYIANSIYDVIFS